MFGTTKREILFRARRKAITSNSFGSRRLSLHKQNIKQQRRGWRIQSKAWKMERRNVLSGRHPPHFYLLLSPSESFCWAVSAPSTAVCLFLCWYLLLIASYFIGRSTGHGYLANTSFASLLKKRRRRATPLLFSRAALSLARSVRSLEPGLWEKKKHTVQYWLLFIHAISLIHKRMVCSDFSADPPRARHWQWHPIPISTSHVICSWK